MKRWKRLAYYLMINILVSACATWTVLSIWARTHPSGPIALETALNGTGNPTLTTGLQTNAISEIQMLETQTESSGIEGDSGNPSEIQSTQMVLEYQVQAGDTLGALARRFEVTIDEIVQANDLSDPNRLDVGQTLLIPVKNELIPTTTPPPAEETVIVSSGTEIPTEVSGAGEVKIENVVGAGDLASERVQINRLGTGDLSLAGWQILDEDGDLFTFPQLNLFESGGVNVYTKAGQDTVVDLYWGLNDPVWRSGETVILLDNQGNVRATYRVP